MIETKVKIKYTILLFVITASSFSQSLFRISWSVFPVCFPPKFRFDSMAGHKVAFLD